MNEQNESDLLEGYRKKRNCVITIAAPFYMRNN